MIVTGNEEVERFLMIVAKQYGPGVEKRAKEIIEKLPEVHPFPAGVVLQKAQYDNSDIAAAVSFGASRFNSD